MPDGARCKGYEDFIVQDLIVQTRTTRYRRERWLLPSGEAIVAPLPAGVTSHFGPGLKRFVLAQYHQGQTTMPRLAALLQGLGLDISKRQLVRLHNAGQEAFLSEAREVLRTGLQAASWIAVVLEARLRHDDTGARHKAQNGVCTQLGLLILPLVPHDIDEIPSGETLPDEVALPFPVHAGENGACSCP